MLLKPPELPSMLMIQSIANPLGFDPCPSLCTVPPTDSSAIFAFFTVYQIGQVHSLGPLILIWPLYLFP